MTTSTEPRVWDPGDPEPDDCERVRDSDGDAWVRLEWSSWYQEENPNGRQYAVDWQTLWKFAPLTEEAS